MRTIRPMQPSSHPKGPLKKNFKAFTTRERDGRRVGKNKNQKGISVALIRAVRMEVVNKENLAREETLRGRVGE